MSGLQVDEQPSPSHPFPCGRGTREVLLPFSLREKGLSKTEVVVSALASYMGCTDEISLTERMATLEAKVARLETLVKTQ